MLKHTEIPKMTTLDRIMLLIVLLLPWGAVEYQVYMVQKQLDHLNNVTFESSRCPTPKTFSLVTLRP